MDRRGGVEALRGRKGGKMRRGKIRREGMEAVSSKEGQREKEKRGRKPRGALKITG